MLRVCVRALVVMMAVFFTVAGVSQGTSQRGSLQLQVTDPAGAGLVAEGTLSGPVSRNFKTDARGFVELSGLPFGHYRLLVQQRGFSDQAMQVDVRSTVAV